MAWPTQLNNTANQYVKDLIIETTQRNLFNISFIPEKVIQYNSFV